MIRRVAAGMVIAAGILALVVSGSGRDNGPHDFAGRCETCHLVAPQQGQKGIFVADIDFLCRRCHEVKEKNSHPSEVVPTMALPAEFVVDWQGRITCATCHDPHGEDLAGGRNLLRGGEEGREFCMSCHQDFFAERRGGHMAASSIAHAKSWTPPDQGAFDTILDDVSLGCIACHEGSVGPSADFHVPGESALLYKGRTLSHPIGMDYSRAASLNRELRPLDDLSPLVSLYEGKVGCASCHSLFSTEPDLLVFNNRGSALCLECHLK